MSQDVKKFVMTEVSQEKSSPKEVDSPVNNEKNVDMNPGMESQETCGRKGINEKGTAGEKATLNTDKMLMSLKDWKLWRQVGQRA